MPEADLVLEGGGVKGIALAGAVEVLCEHGYAFRRIAGTSAGAVVGSLVAAGAPAASLAALMQSVDYTRFKDGGVCSRFLVGRISKLVRSQGIYRGDYLREWLAAQLHELGIETFADLRYQDPDPDRELAPEEQYRLVAMVSDLSAGALRRLPWHYRQYGFDPDQQSVADAVRASISIPFFYTPVRWRTPGGETTWLVDGGLLSNFPIDTFDCPPGAMPRWPTIGIRLSAQPDAAERAVNAISGSLSMGLALLDTMRGFYDRMHFDESAASRTIFIDTGRIKATDFELSQADQRFLYDSGRTAATRFLEGDDSRPRWDFDDYVARHRS